MFQTRKAVDVGRAGRISVEDLIFIIRKDPKKFSRVKELLTMSEELRQARKAFDESVLVKTNTAKPAAKKEAKSKDAKWIFAKLCPHYVQI